MQFVSKVSHQVVKSQILLADTYFTPYVFSNQLPTAKILDQHVDNRVVNLKTFEESTYRVK